MIHRILLGSAILATGLALSGCATTSPQLEQSAQQVIAEQWDFDAYRIVEGQGQIFAGAGKSFVILPGGAPAKTVEASGAPHWGQQGAVVIIDGQPDRIAVAGDRGIRLTAELVSPRLDTPSPPAAGAPSGTESVPPAPAGKSAIVTPLHDGKTFAANQESDSGVKK